MFLTISVIYISMWENEISEGRQHDGLEIYTLFSGTSAEVDPPFHHGFTSPQGYSKHMQTVYIF